MSHSIKRTHGIAFDLDHCRINAADSGNMKRLKTLLKEYLQLKDEILNHPVVVERQKILNKKHLLDEKTYGKYIVNTDEVEKNGIRFDEKTKGVIDQNDEIGIAQRDDLGQIYDRLWWELGAYDGGITLFKHGRGRKRLNQVKRVRELLEADNRRFWLSSERRMLKNDPGGDLEVISRFKYWPTYTGLVKNKDMIANRMQRYKDRKRNGEKFRFWEGWGRNIRDAGAMAVHGIFGSVERAAALPLMMAGKLFAIL